MQFKIKGYKTVDRILFYEEEETGDYVEVKNMPLYPSNTKVEYKDGKYRAIVKAGTPKEAKCRASENFFYQTRNRLTEQQYREIIERCPDADKRYKENPFFVVDYIPLDFKKYMSSFLPAAEEEKFLVVRAAILYVLMENERNGNTYIPEDEFMEKVRQLMPYSIKTVLASLDSIKYENGCIALKSTYDKELYISEYLHKNAYKENNPCQFVPYKNSSEEQNAAIRGIVYDSHISVLTGGPGTGKTTTLNNIIKEYKKAFPGKHIQLVAPTGKARRRAAESVKKQCPCDTIHLFMGIGCGQNKATRDRINKVDFLIVEESSMLSTSLGYELLSRTPAKCKILFVGDVDQLPPVDVGEVFHSMCHGQYVPTYTLTYNFRSGHSIIENAQIINSGSSMLNPDENFTLIDTENLKPLINNPAFNIILTPFSNPKFEMSSAVINKEVHNRRFKNEPVFSVGEPVIYTRTNYKKRYVNGDTGTVVERTLHSVTVAYNDTMETLDGEHIHDISLSYAITVHKSQGSEYDNVLICIPKYTGHFTKEMLYTAVTRARTKVTIAGYLKNLPDILSRTNIRNTRLRTWLAT